MSEETYETIDTDEDGNPVAPDNAVSSESHARTVYNRMRESHRKRAGKFAKIQGIIDGNPPYNQKELCKAGLQHMSNVNWRDGEAIFESQAQTFWNLFNEVEYIAEFCTRVGDPTDNPEWGRVMSEEWDRIIRQWDCFSEVMAAHQNDLLKFGSSTLFWKDENDWRFEVIDPFRFLVPERTRNHTKHICMCAIEHIYSAQELWDIYSHAKSKVWDKEALGELLVKLADHGSSDDEYSTQDAAELQRMIRNGDCSVDEIYNCDVLVVTMLVKEHDRKVTRLMIHPEESTECFIYHDDRQYDDMSEAIHHFALTPGEPYIHGNKGLGHKMYNQVEGMIQLENHLMDAAKRASTTLVRTRGGRKDAKRIKFVAGGMVDIGETEFVQNLMGGNLSSNIETAQYFRNKLQTNNNLAGLNSRNGGKAKTAQEVRQEAVQEAQVRKILIAKYYEQLDYMIREVVRKMLKNQEDEFVKCWIERCEERGVPKEAFEWNEKKLGPNGLPKHLEVTATRASGSGSQFADQIEMEKMMSLLPTLGERGRKAALRDYIAAFRGYKYLGRYLPPEDTNDQPTADDTLASIENNQLENGEQVIVSPDSNHAVHAERHISRMQQAAKLYEEGRYGTSPEEGLQEIAKYFSVAGPHLTKHILFLDQDPTRKSQAKELKQKWSILANFADMVTHNARQQQEAQQNKAEKLTQEQQNQQTEVQLKREKQQGDMQLKRERQAMEQQNKQEVSSFKHLLAQQELSHKAELDQYKTMNDIAKDNAKTENDILLEQAKTAQEINRGKEESDLF